jgi:hypothetical protein
MLKHTHLSWTIIWSGTVQSHWLTFRTTMDLSMLGAGSFSLRSHVDQVLGPTEHSSVHRHIQWENTTRAWCSNTEYKADVLPHFPYTSSRHWDNIAFTSKHIILPSSLWYLIYFSASKPCTDYKDWYLPHFPQVLTLLQNTPLHSYTVH